MSDASSMILIGVGGAGASAARGVGRAFGGGLRLQLADTDASSAREGEPFTLLGGDRLSGRGTGGDAVAGRLAAEDSIQALDTALEGVRLAVVVTCLGGGTGGGATVEAVRHFAERGITSVVFATTPFAFEGDDRQRNARGVMSMIEDYANAVFFLPMDRLAGDPSATMDDALRRGIDVLASAVTLFWRLAEKPGYLRLDAERIRHLVGRAGRGRFATVTVQGPDRDAQAVDLLRRSELLAGGTGPVRAILCGVLAGEDLRLAELGRIADGVREAYGAKCAFELATVNDEATFTGRVSVVVMLFEAGGRDAAGPSSAAARKRVAALKPGPRDRGRFNNAELTVWNGEDLDTPTFVRRNISLDM